LLAAAVLAAAGCGTGGKASGQADAQNGQKLFTAKCAGCHTLAAAGAKGTVGPDLDKALPTMNAAQIRRDILQPNARIAPGYQPNIMPPNFGDTLSPQQVDALVKYLSDVTNK
jgi:cytochrome c oxidase subunit 2